MKKLIIIALVLLAAIPAFAADNQIGITATPPDGSGAATQA